MVVVYCIWHDVLYDLQVTVRPSTGTRIKPASSRPKNKSPKIFVRKQGSWGYTVFVLNPGDCWCATIDTECRGLAFSCRALSDASRSARPFLQCRSAGGLLFDKDRPCFQKLRFLPPHLRAGVREYVFFRAGEEGGRVWRRGGGAWRRVARGG